MPVFAPELSNTVVTLEPLRASHAADLAAATRDDPEAFRYFARSIEPTSEASLRVHVDLLLGAPDVRGYAVRLRATGEVVGCTTLLDIREASLGAEIGWTFYAAAVRGTSVNPSCKLLLMEHAFGGGLFGTPAIRVQLKTDARNARSRRAIEKLGAVLEGVLRNHVIMSDGHLRATAVYSVTAAEWEGVRARLVERIAAWGTGVSGVSGVSGSG